MFKQLLTSEEYFLIQESVRTKVESTFNEVTNDRDALNIINLALKKSYEKCKNALNDEITKVNHLNALLNTERDRSAALEEKLLVLQKTKSKSDNSDGDNVINNPFEDNSITDKNHDLQAIVAKQIAQIKQLNSEYDKLNENVSSLIQEKVKLQTKLKEMELKNNVDDNKERDLNEEKLLYAEQVNELRTRLDETFNDLSSVRRENTNKICDLLDKLSQKDMQINSLTSTNSNLEHMVSKYSAEIEETKGKLSKYVEEMENGFRDYSRQLKSSERLIDKYKELYEKESVNYSKSRDVVDNLEKKLLNECKQKDVLKREYEFQLKSAEEIIENQKNSIDSLQTKIAQIEREIKLQDLSKVSPNMAGLCRIKESGLNLSELPSEYNKVCERLEFMIKENSRLNELLKTLTLESELKEAALKGKCLEAEDCLISVEQMIVAFDELQTERAVLLKKVSEVENNQPLSFREKQRFKQKIADLNRQVCSLLNQIQIARGGYPSKQQLSPGYSDLQTSDDLITHKLVPFRDIEELQEKNEQLISTIRDLSESHAALENQLGGCNKEEFEKKIEMLEKSLAEEKVEIEHQKKVIIFLENKSKLYKILHNQQPSPEFALDNKLAYLNNSTQQVDKSFERSELESPRIKQLEEELGETKKALESLDLEYRQFKEKSNENEVLLKDSLKKSQAKATDVTEKLNVLVSSMTVLKDKLKLAEDRNKLLECRISCLAENDKNWNNHIEKLRSDNENIRKKYAEAEKRSDSLKLELSKYQRTCADLRQLKSELEVKNNLLNTEIKKDESLLLEIESLKLNLERNYGNQISNLEEQFKAVFKESCSLRLTSEMNNNRLEKLVNFLKNQLDATEISLKETCEENITLKRTVEELNNTISEVTIRQSSDNLVHTVTEERVTEHHEKSTAENEFITETVLADESKRDQRNVNELIETYKTQTTCAVNRLTKYKNETDAKLTELSDQNTRLKGENAELTEKLRHSLELKEKTEINLRNQLNDTEKLYSASVKKISDLQNQLESRKQELAEARESQQITEKKYNEEIVLHTADIQKLHELSNCIMELRSQLLLSHNEKEKGKATEKPNEEQEEQTSTDVDFEQYVNPLKELSAEHNLLLKEIRETLKLRVNELNESAEISFDSSQINSSFSENSDLFNLVIRLKKELNTALIKLENSNEENLRLKSELDEAGKKLDETAKVIDLKKTETEISNKLISQQAAVFNKISTLDAVSDCNEILRTQNNSIKTELLGVQEKFEKAKKVSDSLEAENRRLLHESNAYRNECDNLRNELRQYRDRTSELMDKLAKNNLDELLISLTTERINHDKTMNLLVEMRRNKCELEDNLETLKSELSNSQRMYIDLENKFTLIKSDYAKAGEEITELRDSQLVQAELVNQMNQLKIIAKKYKSRYTELMKTMPNRDLNEQSTADISESAALTDVNAADEGRLVTNVQVDPALKNDSIQQSESTANEVAKLKNEIETLKTTMTENGNRYKDVFTKAQSKIVNLTNALNKAQTELKNFKRDTKLTETGSPSKEYSTEIVESDVEKLKLVKENESLKQQLDKLQQQLASQQNAKATSTGQEKTVVTEIPAANTRLLSTSPNAKSQSVVRAVIHSSDNETSQSISSVPVISSNLPQTPTVTFISPRMESGNSQKTCTSPVSASNQPVDDNNGNSNTADHSSSTSASTSLPSPSDPDDGGMIASSSSSSGNGSMMTHNSLKRQNNWLELTSTDSANEKSPTESPAKKRGRTVTESNISAGNNSSMTECDSVEPGTTSSLLFSESESRIDFLTDFENNDTFNENKAFFNIKNSSTEACTVTFGNDPENLPDAGSDSNKGELEQLDNETSEEAASSADQQLSSSSVELMPESEASGQTSTVEDEKIIKTSSVEDGQVAKGTIDGQASKSTAEVGEKNKSSPENEVAATKGSKSTSAGNSAVPAAAVRRGAAGSARFATRSLRSAHTRQNNAKSWHSQQDDAPNTRNRGGGDSNNRRSRYRGGRRRTWYTRY